MVRWLWLCGGLSAFPFGARPASCDRFAARLRLGQPDAYGAGEFSPFKTPLPAPKAIVREESPFGPPYALAFGAAFKMATSSLLCRHTGRVTAAKPPTKSAAVSVLTSSPKPRRAFLARAIRYQSVLLCL